MPRVPMTPAALDAILLDDAREGPKILGTFLRWLVVVLVPLLTVGLAGAYAFAQTLVVAAMLATVVVSLLLLRNGNMKASLYLLVLASIAGCATLQAVSGTIRNAGTLGYVTAMIAGTLFMSGRALVMMTLLCSACLAAVIAAGNAGLLPDPGYRTGAVQWLAHTAGLTAIAAGLFLARNMVLGNLAQLQQELAEKRVAQEGILRLNQELEQRVRERTEELEAFSYSVSHDLRAPLRQVAGFTQLLREELKGSLTDRQAHLVTRIGAATTHMEHLIAAMLQLSQVGRTELNRVPLELAGIAEEVLRALAQAEPQRTVEVSVQRGAPKVAADPHLMRIVLDNLLGNAWKFTSRTSAARIEFGWATSPGGGTVWHVRDNGAGFDPDYAHKLFLPFERLHSSSEFEGTGVGLATVQRIIERHEGKIWAEGRPGEGAVFRFSLPGTA